jgi:creatinine amidohydrolase
MTAAMRWEEQRYPELEAAAGERTVAVLPLGAVEAHGPHLPVGADARIAEAMARAGVRRLAAAGVRAWVLPTFAYAPAPFAEAFAGTLAIGSETLVSVVVDLAAALAGRGVAVLALANAHFDPAQVAALRRAAERIAVAGRPRLAYPDLTRRTLAARLTEEFRSGACHAGRYETSILLAESPGEVDLEAAAALPELPVSLSEAARGGVGDFVAAGLERAYCGAPAEATAEEGRRTVEVLGELLAESVLEALASG